MNGPGDPNHDPDELGFIPWPYIPCGPQTDKNLFRDTHTWCTLMSVQGLSGQVVLAVEPPIPHFEVISPVTVAEPANSRVLIE